MKNSNLLPCKIVMILTKNTSDTGLVIHQTDNKLRSNYSSTRSPFEKYYELYFISSRKIKENTKTFNEELNGDWYYNSIYKTIARIGNITEYDFKIESTTDKSLNLPLIPQSFVEEYVKSNGKIKEINIEVEPEYWRNNKIWFNEKEVDQNGGNFVYQKSITKTNPDNTVITYDMVVIDEHSIQSPLKQFHNKKLQENRVQKERMYSKEDIYKLFKDIGEYDNITERRINNWIEDNL